MKFPSLKLASLILILLLGACDKVDDENTTPLPPPPMEVPINQLVTSTIDIQLNPYGNAPLAAAVKIDALEEVEVWYEIENFSETPKSISAFAMTHDFALLGLMPGSSNRIILTLETREQQFAKDTFELETTPLPDYLPNIEIIQQNLNQMEPGMHLCGFSYGTNNAMISRPFIFDQNGMIRWYLEIESLSTFFYPVKRLKNGNWIFGNLNTVYEYDMLGKEINKWELGNYSQHHEIVEKPNGNLILAVSDENLYSVNDQIIEIDRNSGSILQTWDLREVLDNDRFPILWNSRDWLHVNSVWYDESDQSLVISARHQGIFKVTYDNELVWILAPHNEWGNAGVGGNGFPTSDFLLTAVDQNSQPYDTTIQLGEQRADDFDWSWGQHAAMINNEGHVLAFDNGFKRYFNNNNSSNSHSRGVAYALDEENLTVQQVWEFGKTLNNSFYSRNISDMDYLEQSENYLITSGNIHYEDSPTARIFEVSKSGEVIFEAKMTYKNLFGSGIDAWGRTDVIYRSERLPLYPTVE